MIHISKHIEKRINSAQSIARNSRSRHHYAVLMHGEIVVSEGYNTFPEINTIPRQPIKSKNGKTRYSIHAERNAIKDYISRFTAKQKRQKIKGLVMIIFSVTKGGNLCESKPCCSCILLLKEFGIKTVTYSISGGWVTSKVSELEGYSPSGLRCGWNH